MVLINHIVVKNELYLNALFVSTDPPEKNREALLRQLHRLEEEWRTDLTMCLVDGEVTQYHRISERLSLMCEWRRLLRQHSHIHQETYGQISQSIIRLVETARQLGRFLEIAICLTLANIKIIGGTRKRVHNPEK